MQYHTVSVCQKSTTPHSTQGKIHLLQCYGWHHSCLDQQTLLLAAVLMGQRRAVLHQLCGKHKPEVHSMRPPWTGGMSDCPSKCGQSDRDKSHKAAEEQMPLPSGDASLPPRSRDAKEKSLGDSEQPHDETTAQSLTSAAPSAPISQSVSWWVGQP